jgi:hypothetical protein
MSIVSHLHHLFNAKTCQKVGGRLLYCNHYSCHRYPYPIEQSQVGGILEGMLAPQSGIRTTRIHLGYDPIGLSCHRLACQYDFR